MWIFQKLSRQYRKETEMKGILRKRSKSAHEPLVTSTSGFPKFRKVSSVLPKSRLTSSSSLSLRSNSEILVHLEPQDISSDSFFVDVNEEAEKEPEEETSSKQPPKRRLTTEIQSLLSFQERLSMGIKQGSRRERKVINYFNTRQKPLKKSEKTETKKTKQILILKDLNVSLTPPYPGQSVSSWNLEPQKEIQIDLNKKQGDIYEAMTTMKTGFILLAGPLKEVTSNKSYTHCAFPSCYGYDALQEKVQISCLTNQHLMLRLERRAELLHKSTFNSTTTFMILSGTVAVYIHRGDCIREKIVLTTLSLLRLSENIFYSLKNESDFEAIFFLTFDSIQDQSSNNHKSSNQGILYRKK